MYSKGSMRHSRGEGGKRLLRREDAFKVGKIWFGQTNLEFFYFFVSKIL